MSTTPPRPFDDARIDYAPETREALEEMYEAKERGVATREGLDVSRRAIKAVPSCYTAWHVYFAFLKKLEERDPEGEELVARLVETMPKNYQLWNFLRQMYSNRLKTATEELANADIALRADGKNYHAWVHRQAVLENESMHGDTECWSRELPYVDRMLDEDVFNNSAWTQRALVMSHLNKAQGTGEVEKTFVRLRSVPHCTAAWNYLRMILWTYAPDKAQTVVRFCLEVLQGNRACVPCLEFLADVYFTIACRSESESLRRRALLSAHKIWHQCSQIDPIRRPYWRARLDHSPSIPND